MNKVDKKTGSKKTVSPVDTDARGLEYYFGAGKQLKEAVNAKKAAKKLVRRNNIVFCERSCFLFEARPFFNIDYY